MKTKRNAAEIFLANSAKRASKILAVGAISAALASCNSVPKEIPEDLDSMQLIQMGQDNYDLKRYRAAEAYFNEVIARYGDDPKVYVEATYELGHLHLKKKRYEKALDCFNEILEIYDGIPVGLPGSYKILSQIELAKIPKKAIEQIEAKKAAREADLAAEAEKVRLEEEARIKEELKKEEEEQQASSEASEEAPEE